MSITEKTALIYCRVSTETQEEKGSSLDSQESECIKFAEQFDYKVKNIVRETFSGGYLFERPQLTLEREKIKRGEYDVIIVYALDRLSRDQIHQAILLDEIKRAGVEMLFVKEKLDDTPEGRLMLSLLGYVAEVEREKIKERCVRGKKTQAQNGKLLLAGNLYGYENDKINKVRIIQEGEAHIVRRIFKEYLNGTGIRGIVRGLNLDGIPSPGTNKRRFKKTEHFTNLERHGKTLWGASAVRRVLKESAYCGKSFSFRFKSREGYENNKRYRRIDILPEKEWISLPEGVTPPIVTQDEFNAVQKKLGSKISSDNTRNEKKPILLRGMVYCGICKMKMYAEKEHKKTDIFRCPSRKNYIKCGGGRINADKCDSAVWEQISNIIRKPETIALELERRKRDGVSERENLLADVQSVKNALTAVEVEIERIAVRSVAVEDDFIFETFQKQLKQKKQNRDALLGELAIAEGRLEGFDTNLEGFEKLTEYCKSVAESLDTFDFNEKRIALEALGVKVVGNGRNIKVLYSFPIEKVDFKANHIDDWLARLGKNDACQTSADDFAAARI